MPVLRQLDISWNLTKCCNVWKIQVFSAVIVSKLVYGLGTIELTEGAARALDAVQLKGIREILEMKTIPTKLYTEKPMTSSDENSEGRAQHNEKPAKRLQRQVRPATEVLEKQIWISLAMCSGGNSRIPYNK